MERKPPRRADEHGNPIDIEGIDAPPEAVGRALMLPRTRRLVDQARQRQRREQASDGR